MAAVLPAGSLSTMVFAGRFVGVVITLVAGGVSSAFAPYFSTRVRRKTGRLAAGVFAGGRS